MKFWIQRCAHAIIAAGVVIASPLGIGAEKISVMHRATGSEVYIDQPPKNALQKKDVGPASKNGGAVLRPAEGPELPPSKQPQACDQQNAPSQACYTATQQARPIPR